MTHILVIDSINVNDMFDKEFFLSNADFSCIMLGLPFDISNIDFNQFIEPYCMNIKHCILIKYEHKCHAIVQFDNQKLLHNFINLYNNCHFPNYRDVAPCLICPIVKIISKSKLNTESDGNAKREISVPEIEHVEFSYNAFQSDKCNSRISPSSGNIISFNEDKILNGVGIEVVGMNECDEAGVGNVAATLPMKNTSDFLFRYSRVTVEHLNLFLISQVKVIPNGYWDSDSCVGAALSASDLLSCCTGPSLRVIDGLLHLILERNSSTLASCENESCTKISADDEAYPSQSSISDQCKPADDGTSTPPPEPTIFALSLEELPTCTVCMRRLAYSACKLPNVNDIHIGPHFIGYDHVPKTCRVCELYGNSSSVSRSCSCCGLRENLWVCLVCGHTGCGRYTSQHAKQHYDDCKQHGVSMELATGRIWDYNSDIFVHTEQQYQFSSNNYRNTNAHTSAINNIRDISRSLCKSPNSSEQKEGHSYSQTGRNNLMQSDDFVNRKDSACSHDSNSSTLCTRNGCKSTNSKFASDRTADNYFPFPSRAVERYNYNHLDDITRSKIDILLNEYEQLLEASLGEQALHYEKLLARKMTRILESAVSNTATSPYDNSNSMNTSACNSSSNSSNHSATVLQHPTPDDRKETDERERVSAAEALLDRITKEKLEISLLETEYTTVMDELRLAEIEVARIRKANEKLMREQRSQRDRLTEAEHRYTELITHVHREQIDCVKEQINDVDFYIRTSNMVENSPYGVEFAGGQAVGIVPNSGTTTCSSSSTIKDTKKTTNSRSSKNKPKKK